MITNPFIESWRKYVKNLDDVLEQLHQQTIIAVAVVPYQRIIPALFMKRSNYLIYSVRDSADMDVLTNYANIYCLEQKNPKLAAKVQSTEYLLKNYQFQGFLNHYKNPAYLVFYQTTPPIVKFLNEKHIPWIGNDPKIFDPILHKDTFRGLLKSLRLKHLEDWTLTKAEFEQKTFADLFKKWKRSVVIQPGDYEIPGGTQFVHSQEDLDRALASYHQAPRYVEKVNVIKISPFVTGDALSMLGCVMDQGVLTTTLQLQLVDVPESLHGHPAGGMFFGHDWGYRPWAEQTEKAAQQIVETIGRWLSHRGYRGIFGIDFMFDYTTQELFPIECNPRYTGAIPAYSQINLINGVPPIDFFTLVAYLKIPIKFDFNAVNEAWKKPINCAHIAITPKDLETMNITLNAGVYTYNAVNKTLEYLRPGAFLHELKNEDEFLIIDQVPRLGAKIMTEVPRLFKFIFPKTIAEGTRKIKAPYSEILDSMGNLLRR